MQRFRSGSGQPLLTVYFIHHEQEERTPSQEDDTALRQGFRRQDLHLWGFADTGHMKPEPPYLRRSVVSLGCAREPLSHPLHCSPVPKNTGAFSTMES